MIEKLIDLKSKAENVGGLIIPHIYEAYARLKNLQRSNYFAKIKN